MPRPRDAHRLRVIKNPHRSADALEAVEDVIVTPIVGDPPAWLQPLAREEWQRVALELKSKSWLGVIDEALLAKYCDCYARWRHCLADIDERGYTVEVTDPRNGMTFERPNVSVKIALQFGAEMERCAARFGITPGARKGWTEPKPQKTGLQRFRAALTGPSEAS